MDTDVNQPSSLADEKLESSNSLNSETQTTPELQDDIEDILIDPGTDEKKAEDEDPPEKPSEIKQNEKTYPRAEDRKTQLNREIRDQVAELNRLKAEVANYEELRLPTLEQTRDYLMQQDENLTEQEADWHARTLLMEAKYARQNKIDDVANLRHEQEMATETAVQDYPELFDANHPDFDRGLASGIMDMYERMAGVVRAGDGNIVHANIPLKPFLASVAEIFRSGVTQGRKSMQNVTKKERSNKNRARYNSPLYPSSGQTKNPADEEAKFINGLLND